MLGAEGLITLYQILSFYYHRQFFACLSLLSWCAVQAANRFSYEALFTFNVL